MLTIILLVISNIFMTFAWYGHLKSEFKESSLWMAILVSWGIAFFEYCFQVPANRYGHVDHGGQFDAPQLKIIQEVITLAVFCVFSVLYLNETIRWNHIAAFVLVLGAVVLVVAFQPDDQKKPAEKEDASAALTDEARSGEH